MYIYKYFIFKYKCFINIYEFWLYIYYKRFKNRIFNLEFIIPLTIV
jgi:hypothetical protein